MITSDAQVRRVMEELERDGKVGLAALRAGMHRNTATRYRDLGKLPSELKEPRSWRTREDPFVEDWPAMAQRLAEAPELEAKVLFEDLLSRRPERYESGQMRTFQRRVKVWRAQQGPAKEVFFAQEHRSGEALQSDFTWAKELGILGIRFVAIAPGFIDTPSTRAALQEPIMAGPHLLFPRQRVHELDQWPIEKRMPHFELGR